MHYYESHLRLPHAVLESEKQHHDGESLNLTPSSF